MGDRKKFIFWLPRIIVCIYPVIIIVSTVVDSLRLGFNAGPFFGLLALAALLALLAYFAAKWPKFGGIIFTLMGIMIIIGASRTSIGVDVWAVLTGGLPITLAGILFLWEGFHPVKSFQNGSIKEKYTLFNPAKAGLSKTKFNRVNRGKGKNAKAN